ncbi:uncharacterized protein N7515_005836 [Penicillium bovifimosum]|uniref:Uncharacterized protein n=1 Tax=Penicillium bovifimosum TaxID=126998 RepID=A0A9W9L0L2_9EURO|nr:uncharacterized protein N7515_005836 [Penicillium bovifimosum]KAJ5129797.1 hypothetical protein N7515_005836 [Penicillium bovifimosum]
MAKTTRPPNTSVLAKSSGVHDAPSLPESDSQWEKALLDVKWLLFNQQYKQCAMRCKQLIDTASPPLHPIRATYLHYHAATAYEYMGRAAHVYSTVKIPLLTEAMEHHKSAFVSLPEMVPVPAPSQQEDFEPASFLWSPTIESQSPTTVAWSDGVPPIPPTSLPPSALMAAAVWPDSSTLSPRSPVTVIAWSPGVTLTRHASPARVSRTPSPDPSVITAFHVTPPHATRGESRLDYNEPASDSPRPSVTTEFCVTPPHAACGESLLGYNESPSDSPRPSISTALCVTPPHAARGESLLDYSESPSGSPRPSVITEFCVTPPHVARGESQLDLDYNDPSPACQLSSPSQATFFTPQSSRSRLPVRSQLVAFNGGKDGPPREGSVIRDTAFDNFIPEADGDPFVNDTPTQHHPQTRIPVRLPPVRFPAELKDPMKRRDLVPSPLAIRKQSGEILMCRDSAMIAPAASENETAEKKISDNELMPPPRSRLPRLSNNITPSRHMNAGTEKIDTSLLAPQSMRVNSLLTSHYMTIGRPMAPSPSPPSSSSPPVQRPMSVLRVPFQSHPGSPNTDTDSSNPRSPVSWSGHTSSKSTAMILEFNDTIAWLAEKIPHYIADLEKQIERVKAVQQARRARHPAMNRSVSFWTFTPIKPHTNPGESPVAPRVEGPNVDEFGNVMRLESKEQRMKRLRKEGWVIGFRSKHSNWKGTEYYDRLCEDALAELGPSGNGSREWLNRFQNH